MNCQVPHCPVVAWKHGLCKDHWMANARNEPTGLPTPAIPTWARQATPAPRSATETPAPVVAPAPAPSRPAPPRVLRQPAPPKERPVCVVDGCERWAVCKGRCAKHDSQRRLAEKRQAQAAAEAARDAAGRGTAPAPLTGAPLEPAALRLVWSCVPTHGAQLHEVADASGLGLGATVTALHALETVYGYVTFDGASWHPVIPYARTRGERP